MTGGDGDAANASAANASAGLLRVVATPVGNVGDLSPRAREALESADAIAAEDTRRTRNLLRHLGLAAGEVVSYYAPRETVKARPLLRRLEEGQTLALVTDGGTPGISDPGSVLVGLALAAGIRVEPVPGPSAVTLALSVSAECGDRFVFEGFLPTKGVARRNRLAELAEEERTLVCFEAPHRIAASLRDVAEVLGPERSVTLVREATKLHEEIVRGTAAEVAQRFAEGAKGEIVLVIGGGRPSPDRATVDAVTLLRLAMEGGLSGARAARRVAELTGLARNRLTRLARDLPSACS